MKLSQLRQICRDENLVHALATGMKVEEYLGTLDQWGELLENFEVTRLPIRPKKEEPISEEVYILQKGKSQLLYTDRSIAKVDLLADPNARLFTYKLMPSEGEKKELVSEEIYVAQKGEGRVFFVDKENAQAYWAAHPDEELIVYKKDAVKKKRDLDDLDMEGGE